MSLKGYVRRGPTWTETPGRSSWCVSSATMLSQSRSRLRITSSNGGRLAAACMAERNSLASAPRSRVTDASVRGTSCASSGTRATSNDGRLSTRIWPCRSRIVPRVARTRFRRMRLFSESDRYWSPSVTWRCQSRPNVSAKSRRTPTIATTSRRRNVVGTARSGSRTVMRACESNSRAWTLVGADEALLPANDTEHDRRERGGEERLREQHLHRRERQPVVEREVRGEREQDGEALYQGAEEDHRDAGQRVVHPETPRDQIDEGIDARHRERIQADETARKAVEQVPEQERPRRAGDAVLVQAKVDAEDEREIRNHAPGGERMEDGRLQEQRERARERVDGTGAHLRPEGRGGWSVRRLRQIHRASSSSNTGGGSCVRPTAAPGRAPAPKIAPERALLPRVVPGRATPNAEGSGGPRMPSVAGSGGPMKSARAGGGATSSGVRPGCTSRSSAPLAAVTSTSSRRLASAVGVTSA